MHAKGRYRIQVRKHVSMLWYGDRTCSAFVQMPEMDSIWISPSQCYYYEVGGWLSPNVIIATSCQPSLA